jgi:tetratricopeptide (TPR) repeat protein
LWYNLGIIGGYILDYELAKECYLISIDFNNTNQESWNNLSVMQSISIENQREREINLQGFYKSYLTNFESSYNLAIYYKDKGMISKSLEMIKLALKLNPNHFDSFKIHQNLMNLLL